MVTPGPTEAGPGTEVTATNRRKTLPPISFDRLDHALHASLLVGLGPVIRLARNSKRPVGKRWQTTTRPDVVAEWVNTGANVGVITAGLTVVDIDGPIGLETMEALLSVHGQLPAGPVVATPRGEHRYFAAVGLSSSVGRIGPGVDVRAAGGYVVAPPSISNEAKPYVWIADPTLPLSAPPEWLIVAASVTDPKPVAPPIGVRSHRGDPERIIGEAVTSIAALPAGTRFDGERRIVCAAFRRLVRSGVDPAEYAQRLIEASTRPRREAAATVYSALRLIGRS
jgi:hypothetical protein